MRLWLNICAPAALLLLTGCGPIVTGLTVGKAQVALNAAKTAGAETHAKYEYVAASEYLSKAREENGYSDFHAGRLYAEKALSLATKARQKAEAMSAAAQPATLPPP